MSEWLPVPRLVSHQGVAGVAIVLKPTGDGTLSGSDEYEVGRVAFVRQKSKNPKRSFEDQLADLIKKADEAAAVVNELWSEFERVKELDREQRMRDDQEAIDQGLAKLRELFPPSEVVMA